MSVKQNGSKYEEKEKTEKTENARNISENFDPPDGGWGWMIVVAAGFSNLCIFSILQTFGLIFKDKYAELGITSTQTTAIINTNFAVTNCMGLTNGPLFRNFSFRQTAFVGALICATSITILSTTETFTCAIIFFSLLYGIGIGFVMASNALALNTYFKKKRRMAIAFSWTCTGMGPIIIPQIVTSLMPIYGVEGTVLLFGGFAFNAVACALLLQPVSKHLKRKEVTTILNGTKGPECQELLTQKTSTEKSDQNQKSTFQSRSLENLDSNTRSSNATLNLMREKFGSQYLYYNDEEDGASGIDVMGPTSVMMSRANDGWFSRKNTSTASLSSRTSKRESMTRLSRQSSISPSVRNLSRQYSETDSYRRKLSTYQPPNLPLIIVNESCEHTEDCEHCKAPDCNKKLEQTTLVPKEFETDRLMKQEETRDETTKKSFFRALIIFFDLDLLRDAIYVNMMLGITLATFAEVNFSSMTPFILSEYGFSKIQVATVMSVLGGVDVGTRLLIPFVADFIGWDNRIFYLVGLCGLASGRIVLAHIKRFEIALAVAVLLGMGKGLRTIFMALVIPSHVPLSRLPAASGLQLLTTGLVLLSIGPIVGMIRDLTSSYIPMLYFFNVFTFLTVTSWTLEICFTKWRARKLAKKEAPAKQLIV